MKREEEISRVAIKYFDDYLDGLKGESLTVLQTYEDAAKWADKTMIDKACIWLEQQLENCEIHDAWNGDYISTKSLIIDFRKAMEE